MTVVGVDSMCRVLDTIVGISDWTQRVRAAIVNLAAFPSSVMVTGPSGTGKELIARAIHALSSRASHRLIPVDCASIPESLFASHMFGHVKGAFTGASYSALGCFRAADGGTLFLDEVGELAPQGQAKLLRVLQERTITPVGSTEEIPVDIRVVSATNRDLAREVAAGRFREDLYYRLKVATIRTMPLGERPEDIEVLARHFLAKFSVNNGIPLRRLSRPALERLREYDWPGNVRELENTLERAILFTQGDIIGPEAVVEADPVTATPPSASLPGPFPPDPEDAELAPGEDDHWPTAAEVEREHIRKTLERSNHNQSATARLLGMDRHWLKRRIIAYGLNCSRNDRGHREQQSSPLKKAA